MTMFLVGPSRLFKNAALIKLKKYNNPIQTIPPKKWTHLSNKPNQTASPTPTPTIARYPMINTAASPNPTAIVCIGLSRNFIVSPHLVQDRTAICTVGPLLLSVSYTHLRAHETPEHLVCR